jgi:RNA polymerase sigma-70 factor (ECF subfamily)
MEDSSGLAREVCVPSDAIESIDDRDSLHRIYERCRPRLLRRCRRILDDEEAARDAVHDVFLKLLNLPEQAAFRRESELTVWLFAIATHHCLNLVRARRIHGRQESLAAAAVVSGPRPLWSAERAERDQSLRQLLRLLDDETAAVGLLYYRDGLTQGEIGRALRRSRPTVRRRLRAFLAAARRELQREPVCAGGT